MESQAGFCIGFGYPYPTNENGNAYLKKNIFCDINSFSDGALKFKSLLLYYHINPSLSVAPKNVTYFGHMLFGHLIVFY